MTPRLSEAARHIVLPEKIVSSGFPAIRRRLRELKISFDPWQDGLGQIVLSKTADGKYACTVGGVTISIGRQQGKTFVIGSLIIALCLEFPGYTVVWTAHHMRTATRTFQSMQSMVTRQAVKAYLAPNGIRTANGEQEIKFANGSMIMFGARSQGFGRGFQEVDAIVFDEAQILTEKALEDMLAATNQARHVHGALLFYMGTPPRPTDPGEVFTNKRRKALDGKLTNGAYVEISGDPTLSLDDPENWKIANASYPLRTPHEAMLRLRENLPSDDAWRREGLGIWDEFEATATVVPLPLWHGLTDPTSRIDGKRVFAVDVARMGERSSIAVCGLNAAGKYHLEVVESAPRTGWLMERLKQLNEKWAPSAIVVDLRSAAGSLVLDMEAAGLPVMKVDVTGVTQSFSTFIAKTIDEQAVTHIGQESLTAALDGAKQRYIGEASAWDRKKADVDITPIVASSFALWGFTVKQSEFTDPMSCIW